MAAELAPVIHGQLDRELPGLRVLAGCSPDGSRLQWYDHVSSGRRSAGSPTSSDRADRVEMSGNRLTLRPDRRADRQGVPDRGRPRADRGDVAASSTGRLTLAGHGAAAACATAREAAGAAADPETERRLRSLGYIQ